MAEFLLDTQAPSGTPAAGTSLLFPHSSNALWAQKDDAGLVLTLPGIRNYSTTAQTVGATDTYLVGSALAVPSHLLQAGTQFRWTIWMTKTAASTAIPVWLVRIGTLGTTGDAAILTFTSPVAQTAAADTGIVTIDAVLRNTGAAGILAGVLQLSHNLAATGFATLASPTVSVVSSGFATTTANLIVGVSVTPGASSSWPHQGVLAEMRGI
jgi:hypothetical protein